MSDKKKKETQQPQEEPQEKEDSSVEENQPQEDPVEEKLRQAEEQVLALNDKLLRTLAEYDNFRKRSVKEKEAIYPEATAERYFQIPAGSGQYGAGCGFCLQR